MEEGCYNASEVTKLQVRPFDEWKCRTSQGSANMTLEHCTCQYAQLRLHHTTLLSTPFPCEAAAEFYPIDEPP